MAHNKSGDRRGAATDTRKDLRDKRQEYRENGAQLGWLIDPKHKRVEIYRPG